MKLDEVESFAATKIPTLPALATFPVRLYSPFEEDRVSDAAISAALRDFGVSIEIFPSEAEKIPDQARGKASVATFWVAIAESPTVAHSPYLAELRLKVIESLQAEIDAYEPAYEFERSAKPFMHEHGYVLTVLEFSKKVRTK